MSFIDGWTEEMFKTQCCTSNTTHHPTDHLVIDSLGLTLIVMSLLICVEYTKLLYVELVLNNVCVRLDESERMF